jgi:hypothetical protein
MGFVLKKGPDGATSLTWAGWHGVHRPNCGLAALGSKRGGTAIQKITLLDELHH